MQCAFAFLPLFCWGILAVVQNKQKKYVPLGPKIESISRGKPLPLSPLIPFPSFPFRPFGCRLFRLFLPAFHWHFCVFAALGNGIFAPLASFIFPFRVNITFIPRKWSIPPIFGSAITLAEKK
jgi:hypothetical protein